MEQELHSFPYEAKIDGKEHHFRITQKENTYGIEQDGVVIAEVAHSDHWTQLSGKSLSPQLMESICEHIEAYYE